MSRKRFSPKSRNALVVLGMHRSGTSALTGVLSHLGCDLPQTLLPANPYNEKGYYESVPIHQMNDAILASGGTRWDDWQPFNPDWYASHRAEEFLDKGTQVLEQEFGTSRLFVLKDPRMCLVMPFWKQLFKLEKITPIYVHTHRNPVAVATSLNTRDGLPLPYGMLLWLRHTLDAEYGSRGALRCFTRYDLLLEDWSAVVATIKEQTGLVFPRGSDAVDGEIDAFLSPDLNNSGKTGPATKGHRLVSRWVDQVYSVMERWSDSGEDAKDFAVLDAVRAEFDATAPVFGKLVGEARTAAEHRTAMEAMRTELKQLHEQTAEQRGSWQGSIRDYEAQAQEVIARLKASEDANQVSSQEAETLRTAQGQMQQKLAKAKKKRKALATRMEEQRLSAERTHAELAEEATRSAQELDQMKRDFTALDQEKWQISSALAQRVSETEDLTRQNAQAAQQVADLTQELVQVKSELEAQQQAQQQLASLQEEFEKTLETQRQEHQKTLQTARVQRANLQVEFEKTLETTLVARRKQSDQQLQQLTEQEAQLRAYAEEIAADNQALRNSTSWKITKPLRSVVLFFRSR